VETLRTTWKDCVAFPALSLGAGLGVARPVSKDAFLNKCDLNAFSAIVATEGLQQ